MSADKLREEVEQMARTPQFSGCALVEVDTGMVWHCAGKLRTIERLGEAISDYWRLNKRLEASFSQLGDLRICVFLHDRGRITSMPCGNGMIIVALSQHQAPIDWVEWRRQTKQIASLVDSL